MQYFFSDEDITRWLVEEEEEAAPVTAPAKAPSGKAAAGSGRGAAAAATAPASSHKGAGSGGAAGKRKEAAGGSQQQQEEEARPSKKGKGPAVAGAVTNGCKSVVAVGRRVEGRGAVNALRGRVGASRPVLLVGGRWGGIWMRRVLSAAFAPRAATRQCAWRSCK